MVDKWWVPAFPRNHALNITQFLYADDVILFSKGSPKGVQGVSRLLHHFSSATSGQFNLSKPQLIFSQHAPPFIKQSVHSQLHIPEAAADLLYLGMPLPFGRRKSKLFRYLISKI